MHRSYSPRRHISLGRSGSRILRIYLMGVQFGGPSGAVRYASRMELELILLCIGRGPELACW
jgi:hypothetical protein